MCLDTFEKELALPLRKSHKILKTYTGETVDVVGEVDVNVDSGKGQKLLPLLILRNKGPNLIGRNWLSEIPIDWSVFHMQKEETKNNDVVSDLLLEFADVFSDKPGVLKDVKVDLHVKPDVKPIFIKARTPPYSMRQGIEDELQRLQREGTIEKVQFSKWATPIVPILKPDGSVRICGDYKTTFNGRNYLCLIQKFFDPVSTRASAFLITLFGPRALFILSPHKNSSKVPDRCFIKT